MFNFFNKKAGFDFLLCLTQEIASSNLIDPVEKDLIKDVLNLFDYKDFLNTFLVQYWDVPIIFRYDHLKK